MAHLSARISAAAEEVFAALEPTAIQESDEVYLRTGSGPIVKIRDELMDVKVLQAVSPEGLEQWIPVMKEGFPLAATDVAKVFAMLEIAPPPLDRDSYTLDQLLSEVLASHPQVERGADPQETCALHVARLHGRGDRSAG